MQKGKNRGYYEYATASSAHPLDNVLWFSYGFKLEPASTAAAVLLAPLFEAVPPKLHETLKCLLGDLYVAWHRAEATGRPTYVAVYRDRNRYVGLSRYKYPYISYGRVKAVLEALRRSGSVVIYPGFHYHASGHGRVTRVIAAEALAEIFAAGAWENAYVKPKYSVIVKDEEKRPCRPPNLETFRRRYRRLDWLNRRNAVHEFALRCESLREFLKGFFASESNLKTPTFSNNNEVRVHQYAGITTTAGITRIGETGTNPYPYVNGTGYTGPGPASGSAITNTFSYSEQCKYRAALTLWGRGNVSEEAVDVGDMVCLTRIFNDRSLALGGRFYCPVQNLPKKPVRLRSYVIIDGDATAELDFEALHIQLLYAEEGIKYEGDAYDVEGFDRGTMKVASLIAINTRCWRSAVATLRDKGVRNPAEVLQAFQEKHRRLREHFYSGAGKALQYKDSCIAEKVMQIAVKAGEGIFPVHDSFIVRRSFKERLRRVMRSVYKALFGFEPDINEK